MTDLRKAAQQALEALGYTADPDHPHYEDQLAAITALRTALEQKDLPEVAFGKMEQQAEPVAWDKPSASFNEWWDSYRHDPANPFAEGSAAYWAWAGWKSTQRQWVGLTDEDFLEACQIAERGNYLLALQRIQIKLKERNND